MNFEEFQRRAEQIFAEIPEPFRRGVDGVEVVRAALPHPSLPDVYTLGECRTEHFPTEFGGAGEVISRVVLYYGSFLELSRLDDGWDWEGELWETVTHEVRHHLESLADEDDLEEMDYAEDQNFARREGEPFDPFFFRWGMAGPEGEWVVDGDIFLEVPVPEGTASVQVSWGGRSWQLPVPRPLGDVHYLRLVGAESETEDGEVIAVLVRRRGLRGLVQAIWRRRPLEVLHSELELTP